jgi:hypothetical protein
LFECNLFSKGNLFDFFYYLDDFFFVGRPHTHECADVMASFSKICNSVSVPIADDKTEGSTTSMEYLGLLIDTEKMMVEIPTEKLNKLLEEIKKDDAITSAHSCVCGRPTKKKSSR